MKISANVIRGFSCLLAAGILSLGYGGSEAGEPDAARLVRDRVAQEYPSLFELYKELHAHPELSFQERQTAKRVADELRAAGFEVTTGIGRLGVVGVLRNGGGPTVLVRADMDALPVKEQTGVPYASTVTVRDAKGNEVPVMHACGHDVHMTCLIGTARVMGQLRQQWNGTLVFIGQPGEEAGDGAEAMLSDGLFQKFPRPDFCLALHDSTDMAAGQIGYTPGYSAANVDAVDILVRGLGGHGAHPEKTKDPVVLAAQIILSLQTIASRETRPGEPVVVTVGTVHGGIRRNIIPDEVLLQLTVRSYAEETRKQTLAKIERIARGQGVAAGLPEDRLPVVTVHSGFTPALYNQPELTERVVGALREWLGATNVIQREPSMGGEDFSEFGRTKEKVPIFMFDLGGARPEAVQEAKRTGVPLPSLHSPLWAPLPEPTIKTGTMAMSAALLRLLPGKGP